ncbi:MAG: TetR/AcrR family transcriptional regulator [Desulfobulbaceae bacterium]|nr:TetR/AcrR family transcriptional regulator [Desulfobulbaceae bacterium]
MGTPKDSIKTKAKIISKAGILFAQQGFKAVTVRDIAKKSGTPLSAINYHFRSKDGLYKKVLLTAIEKLSMSAEEELELQNMPPEDAAKNIIREWLREEMCFDGSKWEDDILLRELLSPTEGTEELVEQYYKPFLLLLSEVIGKIVNKPADDVQIQFASLSLASLVDSFNLYGKVINKAMPKLTEQIKDEDRQVDKIYQTVVAIAAL